MRCRVGRFGPGFGCSEHRQAIQVCNCVAIRTAFVPRSGSRPRRRASFLRSAFAVPSGMERSRASTSLATVEKIGPSSEGAGSPASSRRSLIVLSGLGIRYAPNSSSSAFASVRSAVSKPSVNQP